MNNVLYLMEGHDSSELLNDEYLIEFVSKYSKDLVKGTELSPEALNSLSNYLKQYLDERKGRIVVNKGAGETEHMSMMGILWRRRADKIMATGKYDNEEVDTIEKNFSKIKPKGNWVLYKGIDSSGKPYYFFANYDAEKANKDIKMVKKAN